jgi:hypothetical protein
MRAGAPTPPETASSILLCLPCFGWGPQSVTTRMDLLECPFLDDRAQVRTPHSHRTPTLDAIPASAASAYDASQRNLFRGSHALTQVSDLLPANPVLGGIRTVPVPAIYRYKLFCGLHSEHATTKILRRARAQDRCTAGQEREPQTSAYNCCSRFALHLNLPSFS